MDMEQIIETYDVKETVEIGRKLGKAAKAGEVYCLLGDLGAGKTAFTGGFARGLGIEEPVTSPSFTILMVYEGGRLRLNHFDVYRIEDPEEMEEIGFDEIINGDGVSLIEWANRIEELIPEEAVRIVIERDPEKGFDYRKITIRRMDFE